jgi:hypothetical protein
MSSAAVVQFQTAVGESLVEMLERAVERAKAGQIRAFVMVETGQDHPTHPHRVRVSDCFNDIRDTDQFLAMIGGLEYHKKSILDCLED